MIKVRILIGEDEHLYTMKAQTSTPEGFDGEHYVAFLPAEGGPFEPGEVVTFPRERLVSITTPATEVSWVTPR